MYIIFTFDDVGLNVVNFFRHNVNESKIRSCAQKLSLTGEKLGKPLTDTTLIHSRGVSCSLINQ